MMPIFINLPYTLMGSTVSTLETKDINKSHLQLTFIEKICNIFNKNIKELKKMQETNQNYDKIYSIFEYIANEDDFAAMKYAMMENFCNVANNHGHNIFDRSINECNFKLARLIIEYGRNNDYNYINCNDSEFLSFIYKTQHFDVNEVLNNASIKGHLEVVKLILPVLGSKVNAKDKYGNTALIYAAAHGYFEIVKLLLSIVEIDVNAINKNGHSALYCASHYGHHEVAELLSLCS